MREADMKCKVAVRLLSPPLGHFLLPTAKKDPTRLTEVDRVDSGSHKNAGSFQIVAVEKEAQANIMHHQ
jgi:hypothetical protein